MSELEQTIEELEAEVLAELEEASEKPLDKAKDLGLGSDDAEDSVSDTKDSKLNVSAVESKESVPAPEADLSGDDTESKVEKASDEPMKKLAAGDEVDHDGEDLKENKKMTKAQALEQISKMKKADIEEMLAAHASKLQEADSVGTEEELKKLEDQKAQIDERIKNISVKEDM